MTYSRKLSLIAASCLLGIMMAAVTAFAQVDRVVAEAEGIT